MKTIQLVMHKSKMVTLKGIESSIFHQSYQHARVSEEW